MSETVIFVLGMHRSGTSALSGALASAGVAFGDQLLGPEAGVNDKGFWEHRELVRINEALLKQQGLDWHTPFAAAALAPLLANASSVGTLWQQACELIAALLKQGSCVAIKDPRLCLLAPFWRQAVEQSSARVVVVHLLRHPAEVASSLYKRDGIQPDHANALWYEHSTLAQQFCEQQSRSITTRYDDLMQAPADTLQRILSTCDIPLQVDRQRLADWIEPRLRHHSADNNASQGVLGPVVDQLYSRFGAAHPLPDSEQNAAAVMHAASGWLDQLARQFVQLNTTVLRLQSSRAQLDQLGQSHATALRTMDERDHQLEQLMAEHNRLGQSHANALNIVAARDTQLAQLQARLEQLGEDHAHALRVIAERDQQCEAYQATVVQLQASHERLQQLESKWPIKLYTRLFNGTSH